MGLSLGGIPASVAIVPAKGSALTGSSKSGFIAPKCLTSPQPVSVFGADADGNLIVGAGAPPVIYRFQ